MKVSCVKQKGFYKKRNGITVFSAIISVNGKQSTEGSEASLPLQNYRCEAETLRQLKVQSEDTWQITFIINSKMRKPVA